MKQAHALPLSRQSLYLLQELRSVTKSAVRFEPRNRLWKRREAAVDRNAARRKREADVVEPVVGQCATDYMFYALADGLGRIPAHLEEQHPEIDKD